MRAVLPLLLVACSAEEPVPDDLTQPLAGLFADIDDRDVDRWAGAVYDLMIAAPTDGNATARSSDPGTLPADRVDLPDGTQLVDTRTQQALLVGSAYDVDDHRRLSATAERACIERPWADTYTRTFDGDPACWANGGCRDASATASVVETVDEATYTYTLSETFHRLELDDDITMWVVRSWTPSAAVVTGAGADLSALYGLRIWTEDPRDARQTVRLDVWWTDRFLPERDKADTLADERAAVDAAQRRAEDALAEGGAMCASPTE